MSTFHALTIGLLAAVAAAGQGYHPGSTVRDFELLDLQGARHSFASLKASTTVVIFVSTRCPVSNAYNHRMQTLFNDFSGQGVAFLFVDANANENAAEVSKLISEAGFTFPIYRDSGAVAGMFDAQVTPETFVINREAQVVYHGAIDDAQNEARIKRKGLREALDETLAGKPVTVAETKAFGCTVKRGRRQTD